MSEEDKKKLEEVEALRAALAEATDKVKNTTDELIAGRKSHAELEAERDALQLKLKEALDAKTASGEQPKPEEVVRKVLKEKEAEEAKANLKRAEELFKANNKEFHSDNDPGGIKFAAVQAKLARFSTDGVVKTSDFLQLYEEANVLVNPSKAVVKENYAPYAATPPKSGSGPRDADNTQISAKEQDIVTRLGWTAEKYLEQKAKRPHYVESLLRQLN